MTSIEKHHKHPPLAKPAIGEWGRNEIAILGAPCPVIKTIAERINRELGDRLNVCYVDADHSEDIVHDESSKQFNAVFTDKIQSRRLDLKRNPSLFERRAMLAAQDLILVNGNHFTAKAQIVLLHAKKIESLQRKTDRLTNVIAVVEIDQTLDNCAFLKPHLKPDTKVITAENDQNLIAFVSSTIHIPVINGLVLVGGKSTRMGRDKSTMQFHGLPQREYVLQLLTDIGISPYLSCRPEQVDEIQITFPLITDRFTGLGPYGGILSAMMSAPDNAWLVVATDLPMVNQDTLHQLIENRNPSKIATAFHNPATGFPEPLITLWEPKAYPVLLSYLSQGNVCPRKALINSDIQLVEPADPNWLRNVNTPEDVDSVRSLIV